MRDAQIAQIIEEFINWIGLFAKVIVLYELRFANGYFYKKTEHINQINSFKPVFRKWIMCADFLKFVNNYFLNFTNFIFMI